MGKKILMVGDSPYAYSGFARVMREIANGFHNTDHEVKVVGWCYGGTKDELPYQVYSSIDQRGDYYGVQVTKMLLDTWKPDILFSLGDIWMIDWITKLDKKDTKWVAYFPIDGVPLPNKWIPIINNIDVPVVYSKFAYNLLKEAIPYKNIELILHGVDTETFKGLPQNEVEEFKNKLGLGGKYIVGNVSRNQWRKNLPALFRGFADFAEDKDDVLLFYHGVVKDQGWDILDLVDRYNLQDKFYYIPGMSSKVALPNEQLNMVYNLFDLMCLATHGEGFGLPIAEAHAVGKPILVTDYSACTELTVDKKELIAVNDYYCPPIVLNPDKDVNIDYALVDNYDLVTKLNWHYNNKEESKKIGQLGKEDVLKNYLWKDNVQEFVNLIERI